MDRIEQRRQKLFEITGRWFTHDELEWADTFAKKLFQKKAVSDIIPFGGMEIHRYSPGLAAGLVQPCFMFKDY